MGGPHPINVHLFPYVSVHYVHTRAVLFSYVDGFHKRPDRIRLEICTDILEQRADHSVIQVYSTDIKSERKDVDDDILY